MPEICFDFFKNTVQRSLFVINLFLLVDCVFQNLNVLNGMFQQLVDLLMLIGFVKFSFQWSEDVFGSGSSLGVKGFDNFWIFFEHQVVFGRMQVFQGGPFGESRLRCGELPFFGGLLVLEVINVDLLQFWHFLWFCDAGEFIGKEVRGEKLDGCIIGTDDLCLVGIRFAWVLSRFGLESRKLREQSKNRPSPCS